MIQNILKHYLPENQIQRQITPIKIDVLSPDYFLYLCAAQDIWYVVVESDYLFVTDVPGDIETSFPVKAEGWHTVVDYRQKTDRKLLKRDLFKDDRVNESDEDWAHYHAVIHQEHGIRYALLQVKPNEGIGLNDFGLTFYRST